MLPLYTKKRQKESRIYVVATQSKIWYNKITIYRKVNIYDDKNESGAITGDR